MGKNEQKEKLNMNLSEKIFNERRKLGLSQEQFAEKMQISRQAVSKWESGQSTPDLDKIVLMSQIFGVSTDYLLKETVDTVENTESTIAGDSIYDSSNSRKSDMADAEFNEQSESNSENTRENNFRKELTKNEVDSYMEVREKSGKRIAIGVCLCLLSFAFSCIAIMITKRLGAPEDIQDTAAGTVMFLLLGTAVMLFIMSGLRLHIYEYLEKEDFLLPDDIKLLLTDKKKEYQEIFNIHITIGVILVILAVVLCMLAETFLGYTTMKDYTDEVQGIIMFGVLAVAVFLFVQAGIRMGTYNILLQEQDYTKDKKRAKREGEDRMGQIAGIYWCLMCAIYLGFSFYTNDWGRSWILWPVAGCAFGAIAVAVSLKRPRK